MSFLLKIENIAKSSKFSNTGEPFFSRSKDRSRTHDQKIVKGYSQFKLCCRTRIGKTGTLGTKVDHTLDRQARSASSSAWKTMYFCEEASFQIHFVRLQLVATTKVFFQLF